MAAKQQSQRAGGRGEGAGDIRQIADVEIVVRAELNVMAVAQQGGHLGLRALGMLLGIGADHDAAIDVFLQAALDFRLKGGLGNEHHVVAILPLHRLALGFEHADDLRRARC